MVLWLGAMLAILWIIWPQRNLKIFGDKWRPIESLCNNLP